MRIGGKREAAQLLKRSDLVSEVVALVWHAVVPFESVPDTLLEPLRRRERRWTVAKDSVEEHVYDGLDVVADPVNMWRLFGTSLHGDEHQSESSLEWNEGVREATAVAQRTVR
jgi:hypothetical protein